MKGMIELPIDTDSEDMQAMESVGIEALVEVYREQQETNRLALSTIRDMVEGVIKSIDKDNNARRRNDKARIELDRERLAWEKQQVALSGARKCKSAKDLEKLPKTTLATKSGTATKSKVKSGSGKRKKAT